MTGIELSPGSWVLACVAGVIVGLDEVSWPQAMWSRPIVAATLGGLLFGAPADGFMVGAWLELVLSRHAPLGGARHPEAGPAALTAGAACGLGQTGSLIGVPAAVACGWVIGWLGAYSVRALRGVTARIAAVPRGARDPAAALARRHELAIAFDGARAGLLVAALLVPSALFVRLLSAQPPGGVGPAWTPALAAVGLAGMGGVAARVLAAPRHRWPALAAGGLAGAALAGVLT